MMNFKNKIMIFSIVLGLLLSGCGSGSGDGGAPTSSNSVTETIGSGGGSISLPDKTIVKIDPGILKDGTQVKVSISPTPLVPIPTEADAVSPSVRVEFPANALQEGSLGNEGIIIEIPLAEETNGKMQAPSLQEINDQFKVVGVSISRGAKTIYGWAKYGANEGNKAAVWVGSKYMEGIYFAGEVGGTLIHSGSIVIDAGVQFTKKCFLGLEFNNLFQVLRPFGNQDLSSELYSKKDSQNYSSVLRLNQNKIPLVLVHGIQLKGAETCVDAYKKTWATFIAHFYGDPELSSKYQLFTFSYDTSTAIRDEKTGEGSGRSFAQKISEVTQFRNAAVVVHSMGGLVARSAVLHDSAKIDQLITLATPHHGSPLAKIEALSEKIMEASLAGAILQQIPAYVGFYASAWFFNQKFQGAKQMEWDNFDNLAKGCGNPFLCSEDIDLDGLPKGLNKRDNNNNYQKYIPYAGDLDPSPLSQCLTTHRSSLYCSGASILKVFLGYESDGLVPRVSARFNDFDGQYEDKPQWSGKPRTHLGIHHESMHEDSGVLDQVTQDLLAFNSPSLPPITNTLPIATISSPVNGTFNQGNAVIFSGTGNDVEDGVLSGGALVWTSSIEGQIGTGASFTKSDLSVGTHVITLTVTDSLGATGSDSTSITMSGTGTKVIFSDDFNRPDSVSVGNGWIDPVDNFHSNLQIINNEVSTTAAGGPGGIYRPVAFTESLNIKATIKETGGHVSVPDGNAFESRFFILNTGALQNETEGFGIAVSRSDSVFNNSNVMRLDGGVLVDQISSSFQFGSELEIDVTIGLDGSIVGTISEGLNVFSFSFGTYTIQSTGSNFLYSQSFGNLTRPAGSLRARMDNLILGSGP